MTERKIDTRNDPAFAEALEVRRVRTAEARLPAASAFA
jgi:hypothetical protein